MDIDLTREKVKFVTVLIDIECERVAFLLTELARVSTFCGCDSGFKYSSIMSLFCVISDGQL